MGRHRDLGERFVAAATPRFKDFRIDFEKISNAASKSAREGRDGLTFDDGSAMFHDVDWDLRLPLQRRYAEQGVFEPVAHYHAKRFKLLFGRNETWPDEPASHALGLFAEHGRAYNGVALIRSYVDMQHKRLKQDYSARNPRKSRVERSEGVEHAIAAIGTAIASAIPDRKAELLKNIESVEPYLTQQGSEEDRAWLDAVRRELWMEKRA
jgi:hypothetical protein